MNKFELNLDKVSHIINKIQEIESKPDPYLTDYFYLTEITGLTKDIEGVERNGTLLTFKALDLEDNMNYFTESIYTQGKILCLISKEIREYFKPSTFQLMTHKDVKRITISLFYL